MAKSRFEYVRGFERENYLLPDSWLVVRVDGRGFHKFSTVYEFSKPNDIRALDLINKAAECVTRDLTDIILAYGDSDEYSFVFRKDTALFERRESKLVSTVVSTFTAYYIHHWKDYFDKPLDMLLPTFDGRAVVYPNDKTLRDYLSWRQADCHINNLYNTAFWALVLKGGLTTTEAEHRLMGTVSSDKHELLFSQFNINYNNEPEIFKKGTIIIREMEQRGQKPITEDLSARQRERIEKSRRKSVIKLLHEDLIGDKFWDERSWLLSS